MYPFRTVTHPTSDIHHPTVLLHTSQGKRYLFGKVPEGLQRSLNEQKLRVSKLSGIFLTGKLDWEGMGGLPGMILTVSDQGKKDLNLYHGSNILDYIVSTWRYFVFRFGMNLRPKVIKDGAVHKDEIMDIQSIVLRSSATEPEQPFIEAVRNTLGSIVGRMFPLDVKNNIPMKMEEDGLTMQQSDPRYSDPYIHVKLPEPELNSASTCYAVDLHPVRGKFNPQRAKELGIPKGPSFAKLANGQQVTLEDGTVIHPNQVLSEQRAFERVLIIDIPSKSYMKSAVAANWGEKVGLIYHFLGQDLEPFTGEYLNFIRSFGPDCSHYVSHPHYCPNSLTFSGSANVILKLKTLQRNKYNLPEATEALKFIPEDIPKNIKVLLQGQVINVEATITGQHNKYVFDDTNVKIKTDKSWSETYETEVSPLNLKTKSSKEQILDLSSVSAQLINLDLSLKDQVETITFGTGSALPSKYRNVISNLVRVPYKKDGKVFFRSILLDAGENTIGNMRRTLRQENMRTYFQELQVIFLSHLHADHHLGIISIIKEWLKFNQDNAQKLFLVTPWQYAHFVEEWLKVETNVSQLDRITHISCEDFLVGKTRPQVAQIPFHNFSDETFGKEREMVKFKKDISSIQGLFHDVGIKKFSTCRAYHCDWAYSVSITFNLAADDCMEMDDRPNTFKVSYSGDTRPNHYMFAEVIGQDSDILIHEATLENGLLEEAKKKRHCTINEAIEVSNIMKARKLILTHFSQRYPQLPQISNNTVVNAKYCFAFDSMIIKSGEIGDQLEVFDQLDATFASEQKETNDDEE
jgi:ribonuclease Z